MTRTAAEARSEMIGTLSYCERWIVSAINLLPDRRVLTPDQLARKTAEVKARSKHGA